MVDRFFRLLLEYTPFPALIYTLVVWDTAPFAGLRMRRVFRFKSGYWRNLNQELKWDYRLDEKLLVWGRQDHVGNQEQQNTR